MVRMLRAGPHYWDEAVVLSATPQRRASRLAPTAADEVEVQVGNTTASYSKHELELLQLGVVEDNNTVQALGRGPPCV
jgi:hypothetical protein